MEGVTRRRRTGRSQPYKVLQTPQSDESEDDTYAVNLRREEVPWKSLILAFGLLLAGVTFLTLSVLHMFGYFFSKHGAGWGFFILGFLTFVPGFYHSWIAYYALRGRDGYSFSSIPAY